MTLAMPVEGDALTGMLEGMGLRVGVAATETIASALRTLRAELGGSDAGPSTPSPKVTLKWPNDVLLNGKKVGGILIEVVRAHEAPHVLIGVGVNANFSSRELPEDVRGRATTILAELGAPVSLEKLRDALAKALFAAAARNGLTSDTLARARGLLAGVNEPVRIALANAREPIEGTLLGLSDRGNPLVMTARGEVEAPSGSEMGL
jgi:BirA family biotin operon repressor/biotin-[acetyl-CoA-carboxylase] ligase